MEVENKPELKHMNWKLDSKSKKIRSLQLKISDMYKQLETSYNVDRIVELENRLKDGLRLNAELEEVIHDLTKVEKEQEVREFLLIFIRNLLKRSKNKKWDMKKW